MNVSFLWHIHQPPAFTAHEHYLKEAEEKSYNVIFDYCLNKNKDAKICLNITGVTLELLNERHPELIKKLRRAAQSGQVEVTASAYYHPILALMPSDEAYRQISMNLDITKKLLGITPKGFFPPEMGWSSYLIDILNELGVKWVILDESLIKKSDPHLNEEELYKPLWIEGPETEIMCVPRCKPISQGFWAASVGGFGVDDFMNYIKKFKDKKNLLVSSTDAELLGLHWFQGPSYFNELIWKIKENPDLNLVQVGDYLERNRPERKMFIEAGTWAHDGDYYIWHNHTDDITQDILCRDAKTKIEMAENFVILTEKLGGNSHKARDLLNQARTQLHHAHMSDSRGWDPAPVRIKYAYATALKACKLADLAVKEALNNVKK